jgi:hypothetical protein
MILLSVSHKDIVYRNNPHTIQKLKQEISGAFDSSEHTLAGVVQNFQKWQEVVLVASYACTGNIFT